MDAAFVPRRCGRYWMFGEIASGGMASVHFGRMVGARGFALTVAIKRLLPAMAADPMFVSMFANEARIAARIRHPNVVPTLDVIEEDGELFIAMEYVQGESLSRLMRLAARDRPPLDIASRVVCDALEGLHAAHEARSESGDPLHIVHRDVSPQNIMVGVDGIARVVDFGIAKAVDQGNLTQPGEVKGKMSYVAPEQLSGGEIDRRADIYAMGIVLWELLTGRPMRPKVPLPELVTIITRGHVEPPSKVADGISPALDAVVRRALGANPSERYGYAHEMATALAEAIAPAPHARVAEWVSALATDKLAERSAYIRVMEGTPVDVRANKTSVRRPWPWIVLAGAVVAAGATTLVLRFRHPVATTAPIATITASASTPTPSAIALAVASAATPTPSTSTTSLRTLPRAHVTGHVATSRPAPDCRVPYTIDATGVRVPRPECM